MSARTEHARSLFAPLGSTYDRVGAVLSLGQDPRWRRFLVSRLPLDGGSVLDVATGTGLVAAELARKGFGVTGLDQSPEMLERARARFEGDVTLVEGSAAALPFDDASFDHLTFTYLLRYVDDPASTMRELTRVVRSGGTVAMLEFGLPSGVWRPAWELYVRTVLPLAGRAISPGWGEVGGFLGGSIRAFHAAWPPTRLVEAWGDAGVTDVRTRRLALGGGLVMWGRRA